MVISMEKWKGKVAVVTGASVGIGAAIVEHLVGEGLKVVGLARRKEKVEELAKNVDGKSGKLYALKADVTNEKEILEAFQWIKENVGPIHILINNAGIVRGLGLTDGDTKLWKDVFDTNVLGLCIATREAVKDMKANNVDGHIIHINSVAGHGVPNIRNLNVYPGSKHAVTALTETLRQELNAMNSKIRVTSISPGGVKTDIALAGGDVAPAELVEYFKTAPMLQSEDIADAVIYVLSTPPHVQIHELIIKPVGEIY